MIFDSARPPRLLSCLFLLSVLCVVVTAAAEPEPVLRIEPGENNPRNSEGDFIRLRDGSIRFIYTRFRGGGSDHDTADLVSRVSTDGGKTWSGSPELVVANEGQWNVMSVSLLRLQDGRIALFYLRKDSLADCRPVVRFSHDEAQTWSEPTTIIPERERGYYVLNNDRVVQLSSGRLVAPVALHNRPGWEKPDWSGQITCYLSDDGGEHWRRSRTMQMAMDAKGHRVVAQEPGVVELDNDRLLLWVRTDVGEQYGCSSEDGGENWSPLKPTGIASPRSPATIERVPSTKDLVMVWNDHAELPIAQRKHRTPLSVAISRDGGETWINTRTLADDPFGWYCYTAMTFIEDYVLLGHCAGDRRTGGLNTTQITRVPLKWIYP